MKGIVVKINDMETPIFTEEGADVYEIVKKVKEKRGVDGGYFRVISSTLCNVFISHVIDFGSHSEYLLIDEFSPDCDGSNVFNIPIKKNSGRE